MLFEFYKSSEEIVVEAKKDKRIKYAFETIPEGCSIFVDCETINETSFRALVSTANTKLEQTLKCFKHKKGREGNWLEVANLGDMAKKKPANFKCPVLKSSPLAKAFKNYNNDHKFYPFDELNEGWSFKVPLDYANAASLRTLCSINSKKMKKKFILIAHEECFEVACIPLNPQFPFSGHSPQAQEKYNGVHQ